jgi:hypothetical protein
MGGMLAHEGPPFGHSFEDAHAGGHEGGGRVGNTGVCSCGHTTHAPLLSTPWEARLEEILRRAQRDHPVPTEGERLPQNPYLRRT